MASEDRRKGRRRSYTGGSALYAQGPLQRVAKTDRRSPVEGAEPTREEGCDCQDYANGFVSEECLVHNLYPKAPEGAEPVEAGRYTLQETVGETEDAALKDAAFLESVAGQCFHPNDNPETVRRIRRIAARLRSAAGPSKDEIPVWAHRGLMYVSRALQSAETNEMVKRETGGTAPEFVQGILDDIDKLWTRVEATPERESGTEDDEGVEIDYLRETIGALELALWPDTEDGTDARFPHEVVEEAVARLTGEGSE